MVFGRIADVTCAHAVRIQWEDAPPLQHTLWLLVYETTRNSAATVWAQPCYRHHDRVSRVSAWRCFLHVVRTSCVRHKHCICVIKAMFGTLFVHDWRRLRRTRGLFSTAHIGSLAISLATKHRRQRLISGISCITKLHNLEQRSVQGTERSHVQTRPLAGRACAVLQPADFTSCPRPAQPT